MGQPGWRHLQSSRLAHGARRRLGLRDWPRQPHRRLADLTPAHTARHRGAPGSPEAGTRSAMSSAILQRADRLAMRRCPGLGGLRSCAASPAATPALARFAPLSGSMNAPPFDARLLPGSESLYDLFREAETGRCVGTVPRVPIGYLVAVTFVACCTLVALVPLRWPRALAAISFRFGAALNELPFVAFYLLLASTLLAIGQGDIDSPGGWAMVALAVLTTVGLVVVAWRGLRGAGGRPRLGRGPRCRLAHLNRRRDGRSAAPPPCIRPHLVRAVARPSSRCRAGGEHQLRRRG